MNNQSLVTQDRIAQARINGWTVKDLNTATARVRGPNWILYRPNGEVAGYGWSEADAWNHLHPMMQPENLSAIACVLKERERQDLKWGQQNHDPGKWSLILTEELGEVSKSALEGDRANYLTELVQAAAVLVAWLECELRKES